MGTRRRQVAEMASSTESHMCSTQPIATTSAVEPSLTALLPPGSLSRTHLCILGSHNSAGWKETVGVGGLKEKRVCLCV